MGIYSVKPRFRKMLDGSAATLAGFGVSPDQVTTAGIVASALGALGFAGGRFSRRAYALVPVSALVRITCNALDGLVAEKQGSGRPAGDLYNETADRIEDLLFLGGAGGVQGVSPVVALGAVAASQLGSFIGVASKAAGAGRRYDGPMGKADRMLVLGSAALLASWKGPPSVYLNLALAAIGGGGAVTAWNRFHRAHRVLESSSPRA